MLIIIYRTHYSANICSRNMDVKKEDKHMLRTLALRFLNGNGSKTMRYRTEHTFAHFARASAFLSHGIWTQIGFPFILSKFGFFVAAQ